MILMLISIINFVQPIKGTFYNIIYYMIFYIVQANETGNSIVLIERQLQPAT